MPDHLHALPAGHLLGEYRIDDVLGLGGFGITYLAWDTQLEKQVAIKEYLPIELALRTDATTVHPKSTTDQANYQWGLDRFLDEARTLARFEHPHLNKVYRFFEANGTAYMVLEYIEGETLAARLEREGPLGAAHLRRLLDELLAGLEQVHAAGFVHRDIKPANIMLRSDGTAVLLYFGAVQQTLSLQRSKGLAPVLTPGYAPIEQYHPSAVDFGPWSDLYALGMVAYRCLLNTRKAEIPDAVARAELERTGEQHKALAPAVEVGKGRYDAALLGAVDWALEVYAERRPRDVAAMRQALAGDDKPDPAPASAASQPPNPRFGKTWRTASLSALAAIAVAATATLGWPIVQEQLHWQEVRCDNAISLWEYLDAYSGGRYRQAAIDCLANIKADRRAKEERAARRKAEEERVAREKREAELAKQPGKVFRDCPQCPEMVVLPAGEFLMGSPATEEGGYDYERPQHRVTIAKPFAVGKYEVTFAEWDACRRAGGCSYNPDDEGWGRGKHPVINVDWYDAQNYRIWLSRKTGERYWLLSESEWEYAARAGTTTPFHFGATISTDQANYDGSYTYGSGHKGVYRKRTVAVGSFPANDFGLHDMHGNVWERVEDCGPESYVRTPADRSAWMMVHCPTHVIRGGSWDSHPRDLRAADRRSYIPDLPGNDVGFRVGRTLSP